MTGLLIFGLLVLSYLIGSVPFGWVFGRLKGKDLTKQESGSTGATNAGRILGPAYGLATLLLDVGKGIVSVMIALRFTGSTEVAAIAGLFAAAGHCWSVFLCFRGGGRAVSVTLGVALMLVPYGAWYALLFWAFMVAATRTVSVASLAATLFLAFEAMGSTQPLIVRLAICAIVALVWYSHRANIRKLWHGEEKPFSFKKEGVS